MKLIAALGIAGLFSGVVLVSTFLYTNPMIIANKEEAIQQAIFKVLPGCQSYTTLQLQNGQLVTIRDISPDPQEKGDVPVIYAGYTANDSLIGFAVPGSEPGFQDVITSIFGYDHRRRVIIGFEVLESKETPGLGDKIFKDADFQKNFDSLVVEPEIAIVKTGEKQRPQEVEAITGATISSKAVVKSLNTSITQWQDAIEKFVNEKQ